MQNKQTKIIATIAHNRCEVEFIRELFNAGMNVARLNTAHLTLEDADQMLVNIRTVSDRIGVLIDTKGPEVRTCEMDEPYQVKTGDILHIDGKSVPENGFKVNYEDFVDEVPLNSDILIDDGEIQLSAIEKKNGVLVCRAENDGIIKDKKSVNIPNVEMGLPTSSRSSTWPTVSWSPGAISA
jgi:pyruvate kinase